MTFLHHNANADRCEVLSTIPGHEVLKVCIDHYFWVEIFDEDRKCHISSKTKFFYYDGGWDERIIGRESLRNLM